MSENDVRNASSEFASWQKPVRPLDDVKCGRPEQNWKSFCKMSPTEEKSAAVQDELHDVTTCCICYETYRDPVILPCAHTFCLTCLQRVGTRIDKNPGDQMPCPLCREEFTIPEAGFPALKKNFFMIRLIEITTVKQGASGACDKHENENLCLFCIDCSKVLCLVCLREFHQSHRMGDLTSAAEILRSQLLSNVSIAKQCMSDALKKKERLRQQKCSVLEKTQGIETEVNQIRRDLKAFIDRHADSLLEDLDVLKKGRIEDIEIKEKELSTHLDCLKNFELYCAKLASNDRHDSLFCKMASELKEEVVELNRLNKSIVERQLHSFDIHFAKTAPALLDIYKMKNTIGAVEANIDYSVKPELATTIRTNNTAANEGDGITGITGMAVCDNRVFIVYEKNPVISIYDSKTRKCTIQMTVKSFVREVDLRHCVSFAGNVYIVSSFTFEVLRIDQNRDFMKWSTGNDWGRLSVSAESTLVAACYDTSTLREYSLQGTLLNEIKLCSTIVHPLHAIKLGNGNFIVSHGSFRDDVNRVCLVNDVGGVRKSFGGMRGSDIQQLNVPTCLAVDENENILVLDRDNSRVLLLSRDLEFKRELLTKANGLRRPAAMHLDEKTSQLYIADNNWEYDRRSDSKVLVFNIK